MKLYVYPIYHYIYFFYLVNILKKSNINMITEGKVLAYY